MNLPIRSTLKMAACMALTFTIPATASESEVRLAQSDLPTPVRTRKTVVQEPAVKKPAATVGGVTQEPAERQNFSAPQFAQVTVSSLHVRSGPAATFDSITVFQKDNHIRAFARVGSWLEVEWPANVPAYVNDDFVKPDGTVSGDRVRVRSAGNMNATILTEAKKGEKLKIVGKAGEWYKIEAPTSARAYISAKYANLSDNAPVENTIAKAAPKAPEAVQPAAKKPEAVTVFVETVTILRPDVQPPLPEHIDAPKTIATVPAKSVEPAKKVEVAKAAPTPVAPAAMAVAMTNMKPPEVPPAKPAEKIVPAPVSAPVVAEKAPKAPQLTAPEIPAAPAPKTEVVVAQPVEPQKVSPKVEPVVAVAPSKPAPIQAPVVEKKPEISQDKWGIYLPPPKGEKDSMSSATTEAPARKVSQVEAPAKVAPVEVAVQPAPSKVIVESKPVNLDKATLDFIRAKWSPDPAEPIERKVSREQVELAKVFPKKPATPAPKAIRIEPERNSSLVTGTMTYGYQAPQDTPSFQ